jgi:hypothetical protein
VVTTTSITAVSASTRSAQFGVEAADVDPVQHRRTTLKASA